VTRSKPLFLKNRFVERGSRPVISAVLIVSTETLFEQHPAKLLSENVNPCLFTFHG